MASKITFKESKIHGSGIFSTKNIKKGENVCIIKGKKLFKINKNIRDVFSNPNWVGFKINHWVDPRVPYKYLNHSCEANAGVRGKFTLVALKNIKEGEEVTVDYSIIEGDFRWHMKCHCGSKKCRGMVKSIQELPEKVYNYYYPYISRDFQKLYEKMHKVK